MDIKIKIWLGLFLFFNLLYGLIVLFFGGDIVSHVLLLFQYLDNNTFPYFTPLYYGCVYIIGSIMGLFTSVFSINDIPVTELGFFFKNERSFTLVEFINYIYAAIALLSLATAFKFAIIRKIIIAISPSTMSLKQLNLFIFFLLFIHPIAIMNTGAWYFGYLPYLSWHNSTTIFIMPFALWCIYLSINWLKVDTFSPSQSLQLMMFCIISVLIKPSFIFIFTIAFPIVNLYYFQFSRKFWASILILIVPLILIIFQYYSVYVQENIPTYTESSSTVIIPFAVWDRYSDHMLVQAILSYLFPIIASIILYKYIKRERFFWFVLTCVIIAVLIYILFAEEGPRFSHANFSWQVLIANYVLFISMFAFWLKNKRLLSQLSNILLQISFGLHIGFGFLYIARMFILNTLA